MPTSSIHICGICQDPKPIQPLLSLGFIGNSSDLRLVYLWEAVRILPGISCTFLQVDDTNLNVSDEALRTLMDTHEYIVAPTPLVSSNQYLSGTMLPVEQLLCHLTPHNTLLAGGIPQSVLSSCEAQSIPVFDFMKAPGVALKNAVATAEGLLAEMILHSPKNLSGSTALVGGYGGCGEAIARRLHALGVSVTILLREGSPHGARAFCEAYPLWEVPVDTSSDVASLLLPETLQGKDFDHIINTVPSPVFSDFYERFATRSDYYEIASAPGGLTPKAKEAFASHFHPLPGLPGRYAPQSSAHILLEAILTYSRKAGVSL